jgi:hypothetical protein
MNTNGFDGVSDIHHLCCANIDRLYQDDHQFAPTEHGDLNIPKMICLKSTLNLNYSAAQPWKSGILKRID